MARQADPGSYPPATRDFGLYRHWQWAAEVDDLLAGIVSAELDQRGLRPASAQSPATLSVRVQQRTTTSQRQTHDDPYLGAGLGYYHHRYGYWGGMPDYPLVRTVTYRVAEVQVVHDNRHGTDPSTGPAASARPATRNWLGIPSAECASGAEKPAWRKRRS